MATLPPELVQKFRELFVGGDHAHGVWNPETKGRTIHHGATEKDYLDHLEGRKSIGLVPINLDGECRFGAVDIDDETTDHIKLYREIKQRGIPLNICRSKSGGAHLYCFMREPVKAVKVIKALKTWATCLGYPSVETFPKQSKIKVSTPPADDDNVGNWINLSYFNATATNRFAVDENGPVPLPVFLAEVSYWDGTTMGNVATAPKATADVLAEMPPCLRKLLSEGVNEGKRNLTMFNVAVYTRKSNQQGYHEILRELNARFLKPPLSPAELQTILRSVAQRGYQYTCSQSPFSDYCDRSACKQLKFGVGYQPDEQEVNYARLQLARCRKIATDPPRWIVEVNARDMTFTTDQLLTFEAFQRRVFELTSELVIPHKKTLWDQKIIELTENVEEITAPGDASESGMVIDKVQDFLTMGLDRSTQAQDLLHGLPIVLDGAIAFRIGDLQKFLKTQLVKIPNERLFQLIQREGGGHRDVTVKGKKVRTWTMPKDRLNIQLEDFTLPAREPGEDDDIL